MDAACESTHQIILITSSSSLLIFDSSSFVSKVNIFIMIEMKLLPSKRSVILLPIHDCPRIPE